MAKVSADFETIELAETPAEMKAELLRMAVAGYTERVVRDLSAIQALEAEIAKLANAPAKRKRGRPKKTAEPTE